MKNHLSRRQMIRAAVAITTGLAFGLRPNLKAGSRANIDQTTVISMRPQFYHGWPTLTRRLNGELLVVCSGGREAHICPFGWLEISRSKDEGRSWSFPRVLFDGPLDDRDGGILETAKGTLLATTFSSIGYEKRLAEAEAMKPGDENAWTKEKLARWRAVHGRISAAQREVELSSLMLRSVDGGRSWSAPYRCQVNTPHGPIQLSDGRLLYAGKLFWYGRSGQQAGHIGVCESTDDGVNWRWLAEIPTRPDDSDDEYHELHAVETTAGRIIVHIRNHNQCNERETLQSESDDGGRTWSTPHAIGVWGFPSHLLRLKNGHLLMSYGHRRSPLGVQTRLSRDHGRSWSEAMIISGDGTSSDLGYPSTVELGDGFLLTVWYELMGSWLGDFAHYLERGRDERWFKQTDPLPRAILRQTRWRLA